MGICNDLDGWERVGVGGGGVQEGEDTCIRTADSLHHTTELIMASTNENPHSDSNALISKFEEGAFTT